MCLHAQAHISAKLDQIEISMELGEHTRPILVYNTTEACNVVCMHTMCLHAWAHISARLEWIGEIKVSMESGDHAGPL